MNKVLWGFTFDDIKPFFDIQIEKMTYRKCVLSFIGVKEKPPLESDEEYLESIAHLNPGKKHG